MADQLVMTEGWIYWTTSIWMNSKPSIWGTSSFLRTMLQNQSKTGKIRSLYLPVSGFSISSIPSQWTTTLGHHCRRGRGKGRRTRPVSLPAGRGATSWIRVGSDEIWVICTSILENEEPQDTLHHIIAKMKHAVFTRETDQDYEWLYPRMMIQNLSPNGVRFHFQRIGQKRIFILLGQNRCSKIETSKVHTFCSILWGHIYGKYELSWSRTERKLTKAVFF